MDEISTFFDEISTDCRSRRTVVFDDMSHRRIGVFDEMSRRRNGFQPNVVHHLYLVALQKKVYKLFMLCAVLLSVAFIKTRVCFIV